MRALEHSVKVPLYLDRRGLLLSYVGVMEHDLDTFRLKIFDYIL